MAKTSGAADSVTAGSHERQRRAVPVTVPRGKRMNSSLLAVGAVGLLTYVGEYASYIVVLAFFSDKLTLTFNLGTTGYALIGTISGAYLVLSGLLAIPVGHLSDKYGRRPLTVAGCILGAAGLFSLTALDRVDDLALFSVGVIGAIMALGIAHGIYTASTLAYTGDIAEREGNMGKPFGLIEGAEFAGYAFGPALGATVGFLIGTRSGTFEVSAFMLIAAGAIAFLFMPEIMRVPIREAAEDEARSEPAGHTVITDGLPSEVGDIHEHSVSWSDFFAAFRMPIIGVALLTTLVGSIGFSGFFYYVPLYANSLKGLIPSFALFYGYFASIMAATAVILMVPLGHLEDRGHRRMPYLVAGLILGALSLGMVFTLAPSVTTFAFASLAFGGSIAMVRVSQLVILAENSNTSNRAAIMGTNHAAEHVGYGVASFLIGAAIAASRSFIGGFQVLSLALGVGGVAFLIYSRLKKVK